MMEHVSKDGSPKIVKECKYPITGKNVVSMIVTDKGVFTVDPKEGLTLIEISPFSNIDDIKKTTGCTFKILDNLIGG